MRIKKLGLLPFGSHQSTELVFGDTGKLSIIYGPNEAGKSTARRAMVALLFGIDERTEDAHRFPGKDLRITANIEDDDARVFAVARRKGRKSTLTDAAHAPLDEDAWKKMLGGMSRESYEHAFGLDHELLRRGAEAMLSGKGDLGESLFQASTGSINIGRFRKRLAEERDAIYSDKAKKKPLSVAIATYQDRKKAARDLGLSSEAYQKQVESLKEAEKERHSSASDLGEKKAERLRIERELVQEKLFAKKRVLTSAISALGNVIAISAESARARAAATEVLAATASTVSRWESEIKELEAEHDRLAKALGDGATAIAIDATFAVELETALQKLAREPAKLEERTAHENAQIRRVNDELETLSTQHASRDDKVDARALKVAIVDGEVALEHAATLAQKREELAKLTAEARDLPDSASDAPATSTLDAFEREHAALVSTAQKIEEERAALRARATRVLTDLTALTQEFAPPSEEDLTRARAARDALVDEAPSRTSEMKTAITTADSVVDRLRHESERVATRARLTAERSAIEVQATEAEVAAQRLATAKSDFALKFTAIWKTKTPPTIEAARATALAITRAREVAAARSRVERSIADIEREEAAAQKSLAEAVSSAKSSGSASSAPAAPPPTSLRALLAVARDVLAAADGHAVVARDREERRRVLKKALTEHESALAESVAALSRTRAEWRRTMIAMGLDGDAGAERANERLRDLRSLLRAAELLASKKAQYAELTDRRKTAEFTIDRAMRDARATSPAELPLLEQKAEQRLALENQIFELDVRIGEAGGDPRAPLSTADIERDAARLPQIIEDIERLEHELPRLDHRIGQESAGMKNLERTETMALTASLEAEQSLAQIAELGAKYARLTFASMIVEERMLALRADGEGDVLRSAGEIASRITLGAIRELRSSFDDDDHPTLVVVRPDNRETPVSGLSDGARDALYLALRIASLLRVVKTGLVLPVLMDDVLIHFDDDRAKAALSEIATLAQATQVVFFTHHKRLVELAESTLSKDACVVTALT